MTGEPLPFHGRRLSIRLIVTLSTRGARCAVTAIVPRQLHLDERFSIEILHRTHENKSMKPADLPPFCTLMMFPAPLIPR